MMNKDAYYDWIAENDTYPEHNHKWIVALYSRHEGVDGLHRYFGTFETKKKQKYLQQIIEKNIQSQDLFQM